MNIIITGSSKGIGMAIAKAFADAGHTLLLCSRNEKQLDDAAKRLHAAYPQCKVLTRVTDMASKEDVLQFATWCLGLGVPDVVVNNAGQFIPGSVYNEEDGTLEKMVQVNLYSAYYLTRALLPAMMKAHKGHIFNICSIAAHQAYANGGSYSISKFALLGFSRNLREEMKPHGIKVTAVSPGATMSDSWAGSNIDPHRIMEAQDIGKIVYAASQLSSMAVVEDIILRPQLGDL